MSSSISKVENHTTKDADGKNEMKKLERNSRKKRERGKKRYRGKE